MAREATAAEEAALAARLAAYEPVQAMQVTHHGVAEIVGPGHRHGPHLDEHGAELACLHLPGPRRTRRSRSGPKAGPRAAADPVAWTTVAMAFDETLDGECLSFTACNRPVTLGYADNDPYDNRSQYVRPDDSDGPFPGSYQDAFDERLNWSMNIARNVPRRRSRRELHGERRGDRHEQPHLRAVPDLAPLQALADLVDSRLGTAALRCVVCGSGDRVTATFCVHCAYVAPLGRRHYPSRVLQLENRPDASPEA